MSDLFSQISVNPAHGSTLAHQIKQQITWVIASGELKSGDRLPNVRVLAEHLAVNLHTVRSAYRMLADEGLLEIRQGRGVHVLAFDPRRMAQVVSLRSHTVGVILPSFTNPFYHALLQGISDAADEDRTLLFMCLTQDDPTETWRYYAQLAAREVDGVILASTSLDDLPPGLSSEAAVSRLPQVSIDWPGAAGLSVNLDLEGAGYQAVRHLLSLGHQRIGLITYQRSPANVEPINAGYRRALQEMAILPDPSLVVHVPAFDIAAGIQGAHRLLALPQLPSAIFAITDLLAIGAMQAIQALGRRVPGDIALVGFNDIPLAGLVNPPLTTVAAPAHAMGQAAMRMLQALIAGKQLPSQSILFPTELVVRGSSGAQASAPAADN